MAGKDPFKDLIKRRHPEYDGKIAHWNFAELAYKGGRAYFDPAAGNLFKFYKEGDKEYRQRCQRSYRANHIKRVVDTVNEFLFKQKPIRSENADSMLKEFWKKVTRNGKSMDEFVKEIDCWQSVYGLIWIVMDRPPTPAPNASQEQLPYIYWVGPQRVLDMGYDENGVLTWILIQEDHRDDGDPLTSSGDVIPFYRLWTREEWRLFKAEQKGGDLVVTEIANDIHGLGVVPAIPVSIDQSCLYDGPGLVDDAIYMDRALVNYGSLLDEIIYEQTFSTLTIPAESMLPGTKESNQLIAAAKNRVFLYAGMQPGVKPEYISPDASQARLIIDAMDGLMKEIYAITGTDYEANSQSMSTGKTYASGKVRQFDFMGIENLLTKKAAMLERVEDKIAELFAKWMGKDLDIAEEWVRYPNKFDIRGLSAELDISKSLTDVSAPTLVMQMHMKTIADKLFPRMNEDERRRVYEAIDAWEPAPALEQANIEADRDIQQQQVDNQARAAERQADIADRQVKVSEKIASRPQPNPAKKAA